MGRNHFLLLAAESLNGAGQSSSGPEPTFRRQGPRHARASSQGFPTPLYSAVQPVGQEPLSSRAGSHPPLQHRTSPIPPPKSSHGFVWLAFVLGSGPTAQPPGKGNCSPVLVCPSPHGRRLGIPGPAVNPPPLFLSDQRCCGLNTQAPSYTIAGPRQGAWAVPMALVWQQLVGGSRMRRDQQTHTIFRVFSLAVWAVVCRCYGVDLLAAL